MKRREFLRGPLGTVAATWQSRPDDVDVAFQYLISQAGVKQRNLKP
jgi:hypothetical protein